MKTSLVSAAALVLFATGMAFGQTARPKNKAPAIIQATNIKAVATAGEGEHCGFPVMKRWKDQIWLGYRRATGHTGKGDTFILRSKDGETWTQAHKIDIGSDDRNCQFLATSRRLFVYTGMVTKPQASDFQTYVTYTDDGEIWSTPQPCLEPHFNLWKPFEHNGTLWANSHLKADSGSDGPKRMSRLMRSSAGVKWEQVSIVRQGNWESETTFIFGENEHLYALLRQKYGSSTGFILESDPPYQTWTERKTGVHFSGHSTVEFHGVRYVFSRHYGQQSRPSTMVYIWNDGQLTPYAQTPLNPTKGDCSYCEAVDMGADMLITFYSSHEGKTNIYTARLPFYQKPATQPK
ncbi:exo-alpha-sialidase [Prosthecobacter sp.]|uniref:exo-alpha-sialidase n=1 Tax=Prosthecobacter sp. TaxID=1965333 RepID=UPI002AB82092|nr:exo-alpha-sialidase [Prosthecobacter sp.]MDZ4405128.1 exo-alpha-sialidase [Prosthecobacter sp.]